MTTFMIAGAVHSIFVIIFTIMADYTAITSDYSADEVEAKETVVIIITIVLQMLFFGLQFLAFFTVRRKVKNLLELMIKFHDYLIEYRLTPRSRVIRKHLPKLSMVLEEESNLDQSSMMLSQSAYGGNASNRMLASRSMSQSMSHVS